MSREYTNRHAAAFYADEDMSRGDCEPLVVDERWLCVICSHGHHGHICRWCVADGKAAEYEREKWRSWSDEH